MLDAFSGQAALFPLPNVVLFPQALLPLHIFEPRYRQMTADALAGDTLIAMALLQSQPGEPPPIHDVVGLGRIITHERLEDGRYHLVLRGIARARVQREIPTDRLYRIAELELLEDREPQSDSTEAMSRRLLRKFERVFPQVKSHPIWEAVAQREVSLGVVCDLLASALPIAPEVAQQFLADVDVVSRSRALWAALEQLRVRQQKSPQSSVVKETAVKATAIAKVLGFPPEFSLN